MAAKFNLEGLEAVRARMFIQEPFWATLAMPLELIPDPSVKTAVVDNKSLRYNPEYVASLPDRPSDPKYRFSQRETFLIHETCHPALGHPWRLGSRDPELANEAADYVVNEICENAGCEPIPGWFRNPAYDGMYFEQVYSRLSAERQPKGDQGKEDEKGQLGQQSGGQPGNQGNQGPSKGAGNGNAKPSNQSNGGGEGNPTTPQPGAAGTGSGGGNPLGEFVAPQPDEAGGGNSPDPTGPSEDDWKMNVEQAVMVSRAAGTLPGAFAGAVVKANEPKVDWVSETREFLTRNIPNDKSWTTPDRRFIHMGVILPGTKKENLGPGVLAVDCSGSTMPYQKIFASEFKGLIQETKPESLTIIYWDAKAVIPESDVEVVRPEEMEDIEMKPRGFGGTVFQPVLDYVEKENIRPAFMVVLTDLYFTHPVEDPGYAILWAVPDYCNKAVPKVGQVVYIPKED